MTFMKIITSLHNIQYREIKRLAQSAVLRRRRHQAILEGVHLCGAWLDKLGEPLWVVIGESALANGEVATGEVAALLEQVAPEKILQLTDHLFDAITQLENGIRVLFVVSIAQNHLP